MAQKVRGSLAVRHHAKAFKSTVLSVVIGMATLRVNKSESPAVLSEKALGKRSVRHEVIEISSDDEELLPTTGNFHSAFHPHMYPDDMFEQYVDDSGVTDIGDMVDASLRPHKRKRPDHFDLQSSTQPAFLNLPPRTADFRRDVAIGSHHVSSVVADGNTPQNKSPRELKPPLQRATNMPSDRRISISSTHSYHTASGRTSPKPDATVRSEAAANTEGVCPYYLDSLFDTLMYRGPGYEAFPIALGSTAAHRALCDEWDNRNRPRRSALPFSAQEKDALPVLGDQPPNDTESASLAEILEVLPDVEVQFALRMIRSRILQMLDPESNMEIEQRPSADDVIASILEQGEYPRKQPEQDEVISEQPADGTGKTIQFTKGDVTDTAYRHDCVSLLAQLFKYVPTHAIDGALKTTRSLYDAYRNLEESERQHHLMATKPYKRNRKPRTRLENKYKTGSERANTNLRWQNIVNELQAARQSVARNEASLVRRQEQESLEAVNLILHRESNDLVTCQCCFDDEIPLNRAITCDGEELHWFCFSCVKSLAENQLGLMKYELVCMDSGGCKAEISRQNISQAVPTKVLDQLDFYQQQSEVMAADIDGLQQCPHCEFKAICDKEDTSHAFHCANPDCGRASCLKCHEKPHASQTCEQAKMEKGLTARHMIEEARSEAFVRTCPKCKVKIVKETGCNKIVCTKCGCVMCFVCRQDISSIKETGYGHFKQTGSGCLLYDAVGFDRHDHDAAEAEKKAIKLMREGNDEMTEEMLQLGTVEQQGSSEKPTLEKTNSIDDRRPLEVMQKMFATAHDPQERAAMYRRLLEWRGHGIRNGLLAREPMVNPALPQQPYPVPLPMPVPRLMPDGQRVRLLSTLRNQAPKRK